MEMERHVCGHAYHLRRRSMPTCLFRDKPAYCLIDRNSSSLRSAQPLLSELSAVSRSELSRDLAQDTFLLWDSSYLSRALWQILSFPSIRAFFLLTLLTLEVIIFCAIDFKYFQLCLAKLLYYCHTLKGILCLSEVIQDVIFCWIPSDQVQRFWKVDNFLLS